MCTHQWAGDKANEKVIICAINMDSGCVELKFRVEKSNRYGKGVTK